MSALLEAKSLTVCADGARLISDISFSAKAGEFIGVIGPNGVGKSTLLKALAGVTNPDSGGVEIGGCAINAMTARERALLLSYLPQSRETAWAMTAEMVASLGRFSYGRPDRLGEKDRAAVKRALDLADADSLRNRVMQTLSGGEQARIHLARALAAETTIVLADEPTAALDMKHALAMLAALRQRACDGALIIAALHDLPLAARFCTRLVAIDKGCIAADGAGDEVLNEEFYKTVFSIRPVEGGVSFEAI